MPRPRTGVAPVRPSRNATSAQPWLPDLRATELLVTASYGKVHLAAVVDNIGLGNASGPFTVSVWAAIYKGDGSITEIEQDFQVPASVTLHGVPVFEAARVLPGQDISIFNTRYVTPPMDVTEYYVNVEPYAQYEAGFLVDSNFQVSDVRRANNYYTWPGRFWFVSPAARARTRRPVVTEVSASRVRL
jgi:hypothetical protein